MASSFLQPTAVTEKRKCPDEREKKREMKE